MAFVGFQDVGLRQLKTAVKGAKQGFAASVCIARELEKSGKKRQLVL